MEPWHYIVLLGAFALVCALIIPRRTQPAANSSDETVRNMETSLEQFMENMEQENRELVALVSQSQSHFNLQAEHREKRISELEMQVARLEQSLLLLKNENHVGGVAVPHAAVSIESQLAVQSAGIEQPTASPQPQADKSVIRQRYADLFELYDQGKSIEVIAKKLGMNKGEIQLILQLAKQEGDVHV